MQIADPIFVYCLHCISVYFILCVRKQRLSNSQATAIVQSCWRTPSGALHGVFTMPHVQIERQMSFSLLTVLTLRI